MTQREQKQESEGEEGYRVEKMIGDVEEMCTHSEVLLQWVSKLFLLVQRKEEGRGCNSDGNKECTQAQ